MRLVIVSHSAASRLSADSQEDGAADAGQDVDLAERHGQRACDGLECGVAGVVADPLVELLHVADVDEEHADLTALRVGDLEQLRPAGGQTAPVLEAR